MSESATSAAAPPPRPSAFAVAVLRRATANFIDDRATQMAAGIAYFALISLFPLALLAFSIFGLVLRDEELRQRVLANVVDGIPVDAPLVEESLAGLASAGATIGFVALIATIWSGSALAAALRNALSVTFEVPRRRPLVQGKLIDFAVAPVLGALLLLSLALTAGWRVAHSEAVGLGWALDHPVLWDTGAIAITGLMNFLAFLFLYRVLPNLTPRLRDIWPGAAIAAIGFEAVKIGFAYYLANFDNYDVVYGSLGGVITLLFWVYLSANIVLFGAEVAAEIPHVLRGHARRGRAGAPDVGWRESLTQLMRGLVLGPVEQRREPPRWAMGEPAPSRPARRAPPDNGDVR